MVSSSVQNAIKNNVTYEMGDNVVANKGIQFIDKIEGIDYVKNISVSTDGLNWYSVIELEETELAQVGEVNAI